MEIAVCLSVRSIYASFMSIVLFLDYIIFFPLCCCEAIRPQKVVAVKKKLEVLLSPIAAVVFNRIGLKSYLQLNTSA